MRSRTQKIRNPSNWHVTATTFTNEYINSDCRFRSILGLWKKDI